MNAYERIAVIVDAAAPPVAPPIPAGKKERGELARAELRRREASPPAEPYWPMTLPEPGPGPDRRCAFFPLTNMGNADRFVARNKGRFIWCSALGWLAWDGKRYARTGAGGLGG